MQEACRYAIIRYGAQRTNYYAPVAQWIEHRPPEPCAVVRFHSGVPLKKYRQSLVFKVFDGFFVCLKIIFQHAVSGI